MRQRHQPCFTRIRQRRRLTPPAAPPRPPAAPAAAPPPAARPAAADRAAPPARPPPPRSPAAPKITAGIASGSTSSGSSTPPRRAPSVSAAPAVPSSDSNAGRQRRAPPRRAARPRPAGSAWPPRPASPAAAAARWSASAPAPWPAPAPRAAGRTAAAGRASRPRHPRRTAGRAAAARPAARRPAARRGRCRASVSGAGPTPKGNSAATSTKNSTAASVSAGWRSASRSSRAEQRREGRSQPQLPGIRQRQRQMRRRQHHPAGRPMRRQQRAEPLDRGGVQPTSARPAARAAPAPAPAAPAPAAASGRRTASAPAGRPAAADRAPPAPAPTSPPQSRAKKRRFSARRQRRLQRILVADSSAAAAHARRGRPARPRPSQSSAPGRRRISPASSRSSVDLPGAVRAGQQQRAARRQREATGRRTPPARPAGRRGPRASQHQPARPRMPPCGLPRRPWTEPAPCDALQPAASAVAASARRATPDRRAPDHADDRAGQPEDPPHPRRWTARPTTTSACPRRPRRIGDISRLPVSLKVLLENVLRFEDGAQLHGGRRQGDRRLAGRRRTPSKEVPFRPARILMQDFTGVPAVVDLAAMRDGIIKLGGDPQQGEPAGAGRPRDRPLGAWSTSPAPPTRCSKNVDIEFERNGERYEFLRWGQAAFDNFRVVPPGTGICHQVNLEYLAQVRLDRAGRPATPIAYPGHAVGTDSHTTMVNGLGVLGWGVGGIEAEAAMLGQPIAMLIPDVIGFKLTGKLPRRRHRHRPGADRHADAAQEGRGRQVRRVLRPRPRRPGAGRPRDDRQHGPGIRRHLRLLPGRRR